MNTREKFIVKPFNFMSFKFSLDIQTRQLFINFPYLLSPLQLSGNQYKPKAIKVIYAISIGWGALVNFGSFSSFSFYPEKRWWKTSLNSDVVLSYVSYARTLIGLNSELCVDFEK